MITPEEKYFCSSVYYSQKNWHEMVKSFIVPFVKIRKDVYESFYLQFSIDQGAHLKLSIYNNKSLEKNKIEFERSLVQYLAKYPSESRASLSNRKSIFMDFKNNSFYWDLYSLHDAPRGELNREFVLKWRNVISRQIISKLADEQIDKESSLTFVIYVQLAIASRTFPVLVEGVIALRKLLNELNKQLSLKAQVETDSQLDMIINDNRLELVSLANSLWTENKLSEDFKWLNNIRNQCDKLKYNGKERATVFIQLSSYLFEHLNMQNQKSVVLSTSVIYSILNQLRVTKNYI